MGEKGVTKHCYKSHGEALEVWEIYFEVKHILMARDVWLYWRINPNFNPGGQY